MLPGLLCCNQYDEIIISNLFDPQNHQPPAAAAAAAAVAAAAAASATAAATATATLIKGQQMGENQMNPYDQVRIMNIVKFLNFLETKLEGKKKIFETCLEGSPKTCPGVLQKADFKNLQQN